MIIDVLAALVGTLLVGNEFAVAAFVNPSLWRLDDLSHRRAARGLAATIGRWAPLWFAASTICMGAAAWINHSQVLGVATGAWVISVVFSVVYPAPLNARIATWDPENPPEDWKKMRRRWDGWHIGRTIWLFAAQVVCIIALIR